MARDCPLQGTVICRSDRTALAVVEDVFGPVSAPMYLLRFASQTVMEELLVQPGLQLFYPKVLPLPPFCFGYVLVCFSVLTRVTGSSVPREKRGAVPQGCRTPSFPLPEALVTSPKSSVDATPRSHSDSRAAQGSDASNAHDEEVGEHEQVTNSWPAGALMSHT